MRPIVFWTAFTLYVLLITVALLLAAQASSTIPQQDMSTVSVSSEELDSMDGQRENAIDGNVSTIWHTEMDPSCPDPSHPHEIVIDLGYSRQVCGFGYLSRQDSLYFGNIALYEFYVSIDGRTWGTPVATGEFGYVIDSQHATFDAKQGRYVRLVALSEVDGRPWTSIAELNIKEQLDEVTQFVAITWNHPQPIFLAGFTLRVNNETLINIQGADIREWRGNVMVHAGVNMFEMQAYDTEGNCSEWSEPTYYTPSPSPPTELTIKIITTGPPPIDLH